jgi:hypothetical protein
MNEQNQDRNVPLRLAVAAKIAFPAGGMTVAGLRKEAARGRLVSYRIAGRDFTTLAEIDEMIRRCRSIPRAPDSICATTARPPRHGSSERRKASAHGMR